MRQISIRIDDKTVDQIDLIYREAPRLDPEFRAEGGWSRSRVIRELLRKGTEEEMARLGLGEEDLP